MTKLLNEELSNEEPWWYTAALLFPKKGDGIDYPENYWWVGFDCAHPSDYIPFDPFSHTDPVNYRDIHFVLNECLKLVYGNDRT